MKSKKQQPHVDLVEYHLGVFKEMKELTGREVLRVVLQTAKQFRNFRYELVVSELLAGSVLRLKVEGLRTPRPALPGEGPARFVKEYDVVPESLAVVVAKIDGTENTFEIDLRGREPVVLSAPDSKFADIVNDREHFL